jgi:hypothetical protein
MKASENASRPGGLGRDRGVKKPICHTLSACCARGERPRDCRAAE